MLLVRIIVNNPASSLLFKVQPCHWLTFREKSVLSGEQFVHVMFPSPKEFCCEFLSFSSSVLDFYASINQYHSQQSTVEGESLATTAIFVVLPLLDPVFHEHFDLFGL